MDVSTFLQESSKFMSADRPDLWTQETAFKTLTEWFSHLAGDEDTGEISSGGFALTKRMYDGVIEYELHRKIVQFNIFEDEDSQTSLFNWTDGGSLVDIGLNIPDDIPDDN